MIETAARYRNVARQFNERLTAVPDDAWANLSPDGVWAARDVVRHVVDTAPAFLGRAVEGPSVDDDPVAAWAAVSDAMQVALDDPVTAQRPFDGPMGSMTTEQLVERFAVPDLLIHTWDLARATGLDDTLDPDEVRRVYEMMLPNDERMRVRGMFGPKVAVPDDADDQTKLIAFTGRQP